MKELKCLREEIGTLKTQRNEDPNIVIKSLNEMKAEIQAMKNSAPSKNSETPRSEFQAGAIEAKSSNQ